MTNVITLGKARFEEKRNKHCRHAHLNYDPSDQSVECADCNRQIGTWTAFMVLINHWKEAQRSHRNKAAELKDLATKHIVLKAALRVEQAWRRRKMVPTCPHCSAAIFPEDGFGTSVTNKEWALKQRQKTKPK